MSFSDRGIAPPPSASPKASEAGDGGGGVDVVVAGFVQRSAKRVASRLWLG